MADFNLGSIALGVFGRWAMAKSILAAFSASSRNTDLTAGLWECCIKHPEDGAREGAEFVKNHIIRVTEKAFDDFADAGTDRAANRKMLGVEA